MSSKDYILDIDDTDIENRKGRFHIDIYHHQQQIRVPTLDYYTGFIQF